MKLPSPSINQILNRAFPCQGNLRHDVQKGHLRAGAGGEGPGQLQGSGGGTLTADADQHVFDRRRRPPDGEQGRGQVIGQPGGGGTQVEAGQTAPAQGLSLVSVAY